MEQPKRERFVNTGSNRYNGNTRFSRMNDQKENAEAYFSKLCYDVTWIKNEATHEMVDFAEKSGKYMADNGLTNSKIRSIYGEIKRIQMGNFEKEKSSFYLLKPKVAYALGRDDKNQGLKLFKMIFDKCFIDVTDQKSYHNFCNLIEAILAYHKAYGGKD